MSFADFENIMTKLLKVPHSEINQILQNLYLAN